MNKVRSHYCGLCGGFHVSRSCPKFGADLQPKFAVGKVTGFEPKVSFPDTHIKTSFPDLPTGQTSLMDHREFPKIPRPLEPGQMGERTAKWVRDQMMVGEYQAMQRAVALGFKIVVAPHLRGAETEIHVSQERYDQLKAVTKEEDNEKRV